jgi:DNA repair exonuclease SbcCD nuclease subunit
MTVLVTADWHLTELPKDAYRYKALEWIYDYATKHDVECVVILGDLTHNKNNHPDRLVNNVVELLHKFASRFRVIILQGNHDYIESDCAFFHFVRLIKGIEWIRRPQLTPIKGLGSCGFLPHTRDYAKDWGNIKRDWSDVALIFAHNAFDGASAESGRELSGIPRSVFPDVQVISGDIHCPQVIGDDCQVIYVGAPYTQKFGDDYEPRILLLSNRAITSVSVPGPQKVLFDLKSENPKEWEKKLKYKEGDMIKVRYHLANGQRDEWSEIRKRLQTFFGEDAMIQPIIAKEAMERVTGKHEHQSDKDLVRSYGQHEELSPDIMVIGYELCDEL